MDEEYEKGRKEMAQHIAKWMFEGGYDSKSVQIILQKDLSQDEIMKISETTQHGVSNNGGRKRLIATKKVEMRPFRHYLGKTYYCLTFDVTEEIREMFGIPIKEAFVVYRKDKKPFENPSKTQNYAYEEALQIPYRGEIFVVFDDDHTVCFWSSDFGGGIKKTKLDSIDFGDGFIARCEETANSQKKNVRN